MPSCDTCGLLKVPDNPDHARHYRICTWQPRALPEPVLHLENLALKRMSAARWITVKALTETPDKLPPCSCWQASNGVGSSLSVAMATEKLLCNFIGDFKVGDNIVRNGDALCKLVSTNNEGVFNKLIVIQVGSLVEAALDQIFYRAQNFNREGVPNISEADREEIAKKDIERFDAIIRIMKKYKFLDDLGADVYDELDRLRQYRNRVHIQVDWKLEGVPRDEDRAFSKEIVDWALALNIRVLKFLIERFPRPKELQQFAHELLLPTA